MYSHYLHEDDWMVLDDDPPQKTAHQDPPTSPSHTPTGSAIFREMSGGLTQLLDGLGKHFSLEKIDTGDILLVLILLFLFLEGDNLEVVITLGLMLLLGLGGDEEQP